MCDEVEQALVGPLQIFEQQHDRRPRGKPFKRHPPRGEQLAPVDQRLPVIESQQAAQRSPGAFALVRLGGDEQVVDQRVSSSADRSRAPPG